MSASIESRYAALLPWIEARLGGRVVACQRQGDRRSGGRPAFFIDVERAGSSLVRTYARMDRGLGRFKPFTLDRSTRSSTSCTGPASRCPSLSAIAWTRRGSCSSG
jgi:hypothetical protein